MLRSVIVCPDPELAARLEEALQALGDVTVLRTLSHYPTATDLGRTLRAHAPDVLFLSFESQEKAEEVVEHVAKEAASAQIIGIHRAFDPNLLRTMMRLGIREFASFPFDRQTLADCLSHAATLLKEKPTDYEATSQIFSFLPSKAGVGTSTLALNVAGALARDSKARVLLSDFDLNSGMMRFLLKLQNTYSVLDAVEHSAAMDEHLWPQLVTSIGKLDVLHAGQINPGIRIDPSQIRNLVAFLRRNYTALCFDLSGNLERYSIELMHESKRVLLICTPEIPSLHLAREKLQFLRTLELGSRTAVVLNRLSKKPLFTKSQVAEIVGVPVVATVTNDYIGINQATASGSFVEEKSELGKQIKDLSNLLVENRPAAAQEKKKFLEQFSVSSPHAFLR